MFYVITEQFFKKRGTTPAEYLGVSRPYWCELKKGKRTKLTINHLLKLACAVDMVLDLTENLEVLKQQLAKRMLESYYEGL